MLSSSIGTHTDVALALLPNMTYPPDIFPSSKWYAEDLCTEAVTLIESGTTPGDFSGTIATVFDAGASAVVNGVIGAQKDDVIHMAVLKSLVATDTKLLEPMLAFRITAPEEFLDKVTGDVVKMRGTFEPADFERGQFVLLGRVPLATSMDHTIPPQLRHRWSRLPLSPLRRLP